MKKMILYLFSIVLFSIAVPLYSEEEFKVPLLGPGDLQRKLEKNKFAFKKEFTGKTIGVAGRIDRIDEDHWEMMDKGKKEVVLYMQGLFHAFDMSPLSPDTLAEIDTGDYILSVCDQITEGDMGLFVKGRCKVMGIYRKLADDKSKPIYITKDGSVIDALYTEEAASKIKKSFGITK